MKQLALLLFLFLLVFSKFTSAQSLNKIKLDKDYLNIPIDDSADSLYSLSLQKNKLYKISVLQHGVDVALTLLDCDQKLLSTKDSPNGMYGFETVFINTQQSCDYFLKIKRFKSKKNAIRGKVSVFAKDITFSKSDTIISKGFAFSRGRPNDLGLSYICCNAKYGIITKSDSILIPPRYDVEIGDLKEGLFRVESHKKIGFLNKENQIVIPFKYDTDTAKMTGLTGATLESGSGETYNITDIDITRLGFSSGLCAVNIHNKYGFIDAKGKTVIKFIYDGADNFLSGLAIVKTKNKYGAIDVHGQFVIPLVYDMLLWTDEQLIYAVKEKKSFLMDSKQNKMSK